MKKPLWIITFFQLIIIGFAINLNPNIIFTWLHELGHVIVGGGEITTYCTSRTDVGGILVNYAGTYGELFLETGLIYLLFKLQKGFVVSGFILGGSAALFRDPFIITDWDGAAAGTVWLFYAVWLFIMFLQVRAVLYLWYYYNNPQERSLSSFYANLTKEYKKQTTVPQYKEKACKTPF